MNLDKIQLRKEISSDYRTVEELTREAFWNHYGPGCDEHYFAHILRDADAFIQDLDIVATIGDKIVGNVIYSKAKIVGDDGVEHPVLCLGPLSVLPAFQGKGVGTMLVEHTKELAKSLGYKAIFLCGDPDYYSKFGFIAAETYQIGTADRMYAAALQALELETGALKQCKGLFIEDSIFAIDEAASEAFDKTFPEKELAYNTPSQKRFAQVVAMITPRDDS